MINTYFFAYQRESRIRSFLLRFPYASTSVIAREFFDFPSGKRKCRQVLQRMTERGVVKRFRHGEYLYHIGKRSSQWLHTHGVTSFHFDLLHSLRHPQEIAYHVREVAYGEEGRADALYYLKLREDGSGVKFFLEWDDGRNYWSKWEQYENYARSRTWLLKEFWADPLKSGRPSFPVILVVTERDLKPPKSELLTVRICRPGSDYLGVLLNGR